MLHRRPSPQKELLVSEPSKYSAEVGPRYLANASSGFKGLGFRFKEVLL